MPGCGPCPCSAPQEAQDKLQKDYSLWLQQALVKDVSAGLLLSAPKGWWGQVHWRLYPCGLCCGSGWHGQRGGEWEGRGEAPSALHPRALVVRGRGTAARFGAQAKCNLPHFPHRMLPQRQQYCCTCLVG